MRAKLTVADFYYSAAASTTLDVRHHRTRTWGWLTLLRTCTVSSSSFFFFFIFSEHILTLGAMYKSHESKYEVMIPNIRYIQYLGFTAAATIQKKDTFTGLTLLYVGL